MPPSKARGSSGRRRLTSPKAQLKSIKKTPRVRNMKIPAEALSTSLTPGWTRATPDIFTLVDSNLVQLPDPFENRRMTRRSSVYWTKQMLSTKSRTSITTGKRKKAAVIGRITVVQKTSSPVVTRGRWHASVYAPPPKKISKSSKNESRADGVDEKSKGKGGITLSGDTGKMKKHMKNSELKKITSATPLAKNQAKKSPKLPSSLKGAAEKPAGQKNVGNSPKTNVVVLSHMSPSIGKGGKKSTDSAQKKSNRIGKKVVNPTTVLNNLTPEVIRKSAGQKSADKQRTLNSNLAANRKSLQTKIKSADTSKGKTNKKTADVDISKESTHETSEVEKTVLAEQFRKGSTKKQKTPRVLMSKLDNVTKQSSLTARSAKKRVISATDSVDATVLKPSSKQPRNKENSATSLELVSPATEVMRSVKVARVKKVSMMMPDVNSPVNITPRSAKRKIVKTPFKAAKLLGKDESPTGSTPQKAARILGKLDSNMSVQKRDSKLLTSTPLRSARKRPADRLLPMSEISKRAHPMDQEESLVLLGKDIQSTVMSDLASPNRLKMDEISATDLNQSTSVADRDVGGWWGWVCQIL